MSRERGKGGRMKERKEGRREVKEKGEGGTEKQDAGIGREVAEKEGSPRMEEGKGSKEREGRIGNK